MTVLKAIVTNTESFLIQAHDCQQSGWYDINAVKETHNTAKPTEQQRAMQQRARDEAARVRAK